MISVFSLWGFNEKRLLVFSEHCSPDKLICCPPFSKLISGFEESFQIDQSAAQVARFVEQIKNF